MFVVFLKYIYIKNDKTTPCIMLMRIWFWNILIWLKKVVLICNHSREPKRRIRAACFIQDKRISTMCVFFCLCSCYHIWMFKRIIRMKRVVILRYKSYNWKKKQASINIFCFTYEAFFWSEDFAIVLEAYNTRSNETIIMMLSWQKKYNFLFNRAIT